MRLSIQIFVWTLLIVALLGPHKAWSVCLTGKCTVRAEAQVATETDDCFCCNHHASDGRGKSDGENRGDACPGCCVDLAMAIDEGPLPQPVQAPDVDHGVVAVVPEPMFDASTAVAARFAGHDTGPPRVDRRTALIATTILRE